MDKNLFCMDCGMKKEVEYSKLKLSDDEHLEIAAGLMISDKFTCNECQCLIEVGATAFYFTFLPGFVSFDKSWLSEYFKPHAVIRRTYPRINSHYSLILQ